jgi:hypothetical protein
MTAAQEELCRVADHGRGIISLMTAGRGAQLRELNDRTPGMNSRLSGWLNKKIRLPLFSRRPTPSPFARKVNKVIRWIACVALVVFAVWRVTLYREVHARFVRLRSGGSPVSGAELNTWPRTVPDAENGALIMTQAFALLRTFPDRRSNEIDQPYILSRTNQWSAATRAMVEEYVQTNAAALAKAREALARPRFRYPVDYSYGFDTQRPELSPLKTLARAAALRAALEAEEGHVDEWPAEVDLGLGIAGTLECQPDLLSLLVHHSIVGTAVKATERSLNRSAPADEPAAELEAALARAGETNLLPFALAGERAMTIPFFRMNWSEIHHASNDTADNRPRPSQRYSGKPNPLFWLSGFFERDLNYFLATMEESMPVAELPPPQSLRLTNEFEFASETAAKRHYLLSSMLLPAFGRAAVRGASTRALGEDAATGLAVERFRRARGKMPDSLGEVTPQFLAAVPTDPFDGAPLRYRRLASGYVIYSLGADGHDDGGREPPPSRKSTDTNTYDITFTVGY